ncbi:heparinase II/III domain-containing protein [Glutamicibacter arilaitensis]|uniref:heparinase II/III domain-containing protein n=1 Tax=Glutamicibacter arilaitensis TaxID=256701 RepID=UPI003FCF597F
MDPEKCDASDARSAITGGKSMNLECAKRQSFGARYERTTKDKILAKRVLDGRLAMSPHPEWTLPEDPSWLENPLKDDNWQFQYHSLRWLDPLRREAESGDDKSRQVWERYVQSWIATNPPGTSRTKWAWIDMGDALRTYVLSFGLNMYVDPPQWLTDSLEQHMHWLADEKNLGHGNHALHQHQALFVAASILEERTLVDLAIQRMGELVSGSYDAQGVNEEGSISYQEANYRWWHEALRRLDLEGIARPSWAAVLDAAPESLAHATQPNGNYVRIGDMDSGGPSKIKSPYTQYVSTGGSKGSAPRDLIKVYEAGYVYGRSGWGETERDFAQETFFSLCFGPQRKIHGQADGGSITFFSNGYPWLIDTGKYLYGRHPMRTYVVNRPGHNLLVANGRKYDRATNVTLFRTDETTRHFEAVTRDAGYEDILMTRRVIFSKRGEYLLIIDAVSAKEEVEIEQRWHAHESATATLKKASAVLSNGNAECLLQWVGHNGRLTTARGETKPYNGWTSTGWRKNKETTVISAVQKGTQLTFRTVIGASAAADGSLSTTRRIAPGYQEFTVHGRVGTEYVLVGKKGAVISDHPFREERINDYFSTAAETVAKSTLFAEDLFDSLIPGISTVAERQTALNSAYEEIKRVGIKAGYRSGLVTGIIDLAGTDLTLPEELNDAAKLRAPLISWNQKKPISNRNGKIRSYASRSAVAQDSDYRGIQSYRYGRLTLPIATIPGQGETLHVSFHGALDRGKYSLPRFERGQSLSGLGINQMVFADPTLDLDPSVSLAWFLGTETQDLHSEMALLIEERMRSLGIERVVLSGSSGGGFAALQVAAFLPESKVIAFNPQTCVTAYHARLAQKATDVVFPDGVVNNDGIRQRLDVAERYKELNPKVDVIFIRNDADAHHSSQHRQPFLKKVEDLAGISARTITESWGSGHRSPNAEVYMRLLGEAGLHPIEKELALGGTEH